MNDKLAKIIGLFFAAATLFGFVGYALQYPNVASSSAISIGFPNLTTVAVGAIDNKRSQIYLNGTWQFVPAVGNPQNPPVSPNWGSISVPGDWQKENNESVPGIITRGSGKEWENFNSKQLSKAWYQRNIDIPGDWTNRRIFLDLARVSTDAVIFVNGINCGQIPWPYGTIEITKVAKPGQNTLSILVVAVSDEKEKAVIMDPTEIYTEKANLHSRGIIGEVRLLSLPPGPLISDVFVQTSTRKKQVKLDVELKDVAQNGQVELIAQMLDEKGKVEQKFTGTARVQAKPIQTVQVQWNWPNPRLWEVAQPNLYTLQLEVKGSGIDTQYDQPFGFREFWIEGRKFFLNGTEFRLRPNLHSDTWQGGTVEVSDRLIDGYVKAGFNITEMWPWNHDERGRWHFRELFSERADLKGFPIMAPALDISPIAWNGKWKNRQWNDRWKARMVTEMRRYRNHPSVLMWATSPNFFGHADDQNPRRIGKRKVEATLSPYESERLRVNTPLGNDAIAAIKSADPTRPVMVHQGANFGDVYALNSYLNMIPLQEREEWISEWSKTGEMPYMAVEFGTPLHATMMRNRKGFGQVILSEPWMTEFAAIYFGKQAYELETAAYKAKIREQFVNGQEYQSWHGKKELDFAPAFQKLQQLFSTNTWRSWRTFGMSGGMIPWNDGHGWEVSEAGRKKVDIGAFQPGRRGVYLKQVSNNLLNYLQPEAYTVHPGGEAIMNNNSSTLAWIAGASPVFTAKDHNLFVGAKLAKQVVLINDTRAAQEFSFKWRVLVGGKEVKKGEQKGRIESAGTLFFPIDVNLPNTISSKADGEIRLTARVGERSHSDTFAFRVFPKQAKSKDTLTIFDPAGKTSAMLKQLGHPLLPWNGSQVSSLLIIGREAFSSGEKLPGSLENFVRNGGKAIVFPQRREWLKNTGFRVAAHVSRRAYSVDSNHPAISGLDSEDLRDWVGESTLVEAYPDTSKTGPNLSPANKPWYGWRWGNRGGVSSASIEKPHRSGWRPILESEFDLAYSPLMELDYGKGRLILNELDLEDHYSVDAGAAQLVQQIVSYGMNSPVVGKPEKVVLIGGDGDAQKLDSLGVIYQRASSLSNDFGLVIVGKEANLKDADLRGYLNAGGKAFFLPRQVPVAGLGVGLQQAQDFGGSLAVPSWDEVKGVSASDLRSRSFYDTWLIKSGGEIGADGLLSRVKVGKGVAIFSQIEPDSLNADTKTYLRFTRWRQTRANAQILANLGASFKADGSVFNGSSREFYHWDYKTDFENGDDPYRYYRW
ncbi:beta-galactosidase [Microcoleus vaginatus PCC 9802]|uniref:glycoside hydrolase family 2 protein n=1 Tax=Microcoleus vaginatus TaxID=119532 RepID=UPI00020D23DF|nr:glycoside hydrolase family 2 sugar binding protein [Microcoleus vaginatus FGP-2]UNU21593.1 beta-galactosidase [Microcoleus vaginatus PCC 9802]